MGYVNRYDATAGALVVTLPALSGLNVSSRAMVQKYTLDASANSVTFNAAGSDHFDDATSSVVLTTSGQSRTLQVVSISGVKRWKVMEAMGSTGGSSSGSVASTDITDASTIGRTIITAGDAAAVRAAIGVNSVVFSTADYSAVSGDDRPRVLAAVNAAVAAISATGKDQTVLIHAPMTFTTGTTKAALGGATIDPFDTAYTNQGVPIPVNLAHTLHIVFAPGASITLSSSCVNAFYINKVADYDVFQNVSFYDAWVDAGTSVAEAHALIGNFPNYGGHQRYLSFQNLNFYGRTRFTNFFWDAAGSAAGQLGIGFGGSHNTPLEATQTFSKNIYLEYGEIYGGAGLFCVHANPSTRHRPGGCNHYHDNIVVGGYKIVLPTTPTTYTNHVFSGIYICGAGFGDYTYVGPGYAENVGDTAVEMGSMQRADIVAPVSKNPWYNGVLLRHTHAPSDLNSQKITIRGLKCEVTSSLSVTSAAFIAPIKLMVDDVAVTITGTATAGTGTIAIPGYGNTGSLGAAATASQIQTAVRAVHTDLATSVATGGPLGTAPVVLKVAQLNTDTPITPNTGSLTGGTWTITLSPLNANIGTVTIEDPVWKADGLTYSKQQRDTGLFVAGLDQPHKKVEIIRPKVILSNYSYDAAFDDTLSLINAAAPYPGWGHLIVRDFDLALEGTCDFSAAAGSAALAEVYVNGDRTRVDIDGMTNDRAAAANGNMYQVRAADAGSHIRVTARRLAPKTLSATSTNGGARLFSGGTCDRFDVFDSDFTQGTDDTAHAFNLGSAGSNAANARAARNLYPDAVGSATITPTGSAFTWQNTLGMTALVEISAGTVSLVEYKSPNGSFSSSAFTTGTWTVEPGASLRITYTVAPTMSYDLIR